VAVAAARQPDGRVTDASATHAPEGGATVWMLRDGRLSPIRVRTGLNDGTQAAMVEGDLTPGDAVVTGVATAASAAPAAGRSPLVPSMPRRGGAGNAARTTR
jgi:hypothetical protein